MLNTFASVDHVLTHSLHQSPAQSTTKATSDSGRMSTLPDIKYHVKMSFSVMPTHTHVYTRAWASKGLSML